MIVWWWYEYGRKLKAFLGVASSIYMFLMYSIIWDRRFCHQKVLREVSISAGKNPSAWRFEKDVVLVLLSLPCFRSLPETPKHIDIEFSLTRPYRGLALDSQPCTVTRRSCHKLPLGSSGSAFQCSLAARIPGHVEMPNRAEQEVHYGSLIFWCPQSLRCTSDFVTVSVSSQPFQWLLG